MFGMIAGHTGKLGAVGLALLVAAGCSGDGGSSTTGPATGPDPSISSVEPSTGTVGTEVKITGSEFRSGAEVLFDDLASDSVDVVEDTLAFALAPSGISQGEVFDLTFRNDDGTEATQADAFEAVVPDLLFINGATQPSGQEGSTVVLDGDAFGDLLTKDGTIRGRVLFSDGAGGTVEATIANEDDWTNTFILTTVPSGAATGDVVVETQTGTSGAITFEVTEGSTFSPSNIVWSETKSLPVALSGHGAVHLSTGDIGSTREWVHVTGGESDDDAPRTDVRFSEINADGTLAGWNNANALPAPRAFHASVAATPFNSRVKNGDGWLYVLGGIETDGGDPATTVFRAALNSDGSLGSWEQTTALPEPLHSAGAVIFRSNIYVAGGSGNSDQPSASVFRAPVDSLGQLGDWTELASLPAGRTYHDFTVIGNCLHAFAGESGAVPPNDATVTDTRFTTVLKNRIDLRSNDLTSSSWSADDSELGNGGRSKHTSLIAGGGVLVSAGLYNGVKGSLGNAEQMFAQIGSDCEVQDFTGATNEDNIKKNGGANLFNHAAVSFVDADGQAHVMIIGGDDVDNPGTRRSEVWVF